MARRHRRAPALALLAVAALCLHVQAMSPIYQAMSTMYNSELSRGLQLGEGSEACCEHMEHVACICDDQEEGTPDLITIDLPETATTHRCDSDDVQIVLHEDTETRVCVTEDYAEEHVVVVPEDENDEPNDAIEISPPIQESHSPVPSPREPSQPTPQTVVVVQCNQQSDSSSGEEIVIRNNDEVTVVSGDKSNTDIVVIQECTKNSEGDTIIVKETPPTLPTEPQVDDSIDVTIVRKSLETSISSSSDSSSSSSSSSESVSSDSCESHISSSSESSSSSSEEAKSHQRHCKRVPSCRCGRCMLRRKLQQQQKERKQKKQKKQRDRRDKHRHHQKVKHKQKQKQKRKEKRHSRTNLLAK